MKPLSIAIIASTHFPIREPFMGGVEYHTHLLTKKLIERGHNVTLFALKDSDPNLNVEIFNLPKFSKIKDTKYLSSSLRKKIEKKEYYFKLASMFFSLMKELEKRKFDIIQDSSMLVFPIFFARFFSTPVVTTLHNYAHGQIKTALKFFLSSNNYLILLSKIYQKENPKIRSLSKIIYNGIDLTKFRFIENCVLPPYAVWYGRICSGKSPHFAMDACSKTNIPLKLVGSVEPSPYFDQEIAPRLASNKNIEYLGHLSHEELQEVVAKAQVSICSPIGKESFGLTVVESLAMGVPVAGFKSGTIPELLTPLCGALAKENNVEDLSEAIKKAILCKRKDCRERAEGLFDINTMIEKYEKFYYEILKSRKK